MIWTCSPGILFSGYWLSVYVDWCLQRRGMFQYCCGSAVYFVSLIFVSLEFLITVVSSLFTIITHLMTVQHNRSYCTILELWLNRSCEISKLNINTLPYNSQDGSAPQIADPLKKQQHLLLFVVYQITKKWYLMRENTSHSCF